MQRQRRCSLITMNVWFTRLACVRMRSQRRIRRCVQMATLLPQNVDYCLKPLLMDSHHPVELSCACLEHVLRFGVKLGAQRHRTLHKLPLLLLYRPLTAGKRVALLLQGIMQGYELLVHSNLLGRPGRLRHAAGDRSIQRSFGWAVIALVG
jgi:hypothetical protein